MEFIQGVLMGLVQNPAVWGVIFTAIVILVGWVVKRTKTKKDDAILAMIIQAFDFAEKVVPDEKGPEWLKKTDAAMKVFNEEYRKREGKTPTAALIDLAKDRWSLLAHEAKKG